MLHGVKLNAGSQSFLTTEREWFETRLEVRITDYFNKDGNISFPQAPKLDEAISDDYQKLVIMHHLSEDERLVLMLSFITWLKPHALDLFFTKNKNIDRPFSEFGGASGKLQGGFIPSLETALFVVAGDDIARRMETLQLLNQDNVLFKERLVELSSTDDTDRETDATLKINPQLLQQLTGFNTPVTIMGESFPAKKINTNMSPNELVVADSVRDELSILETWVRHNQSMVSELGLGRFLMPGFRSLFWGSPGTGKALAAGLLGKSLGLDVYRVDLSMVVSKWIGETEKNLSNVFDQGEQNGWILFFDEADALFARRSVSGSSNDRYSNQQVSYLLQRMETYTGLVILATSLRTNLDDSLMRRIQSFVHFPVPSVAQRATLWDQMLGSGKHDSVDIDALAEEFELTGGVIANVVQFAILISSGEGRKEMFEEDLRRGIARELKKEAGIHEEINGVH